MHCCNPSPLRGAPLQQGSFSSPEDSSPVLRGAGSRSETEGLRCFPHHNISCVHLRRKILHGCPNKKLTVHIDIHTTKKKYQNVRILIHQKVMAIQRTVVCLPWDSHSVQGFPKVIASLIGIRSRYSIIHRGSHGTGILH